MNIPTFIQKYKPYYIDDFYLEPAKKAVLKMLIDMNSLNMLIVGEASTGKTTFLYALIREYYNFGKEEAFRDQDVLFINNLKEQQGISYFRNEMKTFCQTRTNGTKKKMIIIDDIDTIHQQCQQVLCNYIDKYNKTVHFVFSCNNVQKVIENIQSRVQIVGLEPPVADHLRHLYRRIVATEGLQLREADQPSIEDFVVTLSNNSLRELINIMEKIIVYFGDTGPSDIITVEVCKSLFLTRIYQHFHDFIARLREGDLGEGIRIMYLVVANGYSIVDIYDYFFKFLKMTDHVSETEKYEIIKVLCKYITVIHNVHEETIEMVLFTNHVYKVLRTGA